MRAGLCSWNGPALTDTERLALLFMHYDVFNGDADGICSLQQLRLARPITESQPVTGVKRDIQLLARVQHVRQSSFSVLDISLDKNRPALQHLLEQQNQVLYFDHHFAGEIPLSPLLSAHIDLRPDTCTSLIVDAFLGGKFSRWAICGAFGDNLHKPARDLAASLSLTEEQILQLQEIGDLLNYNSYGETAEDLRISPEELYAAVKPFVDPLAFHGAPEVLPSLRQGFQEDMELALAQKVHRPMGKNRVYFFPDAAWARRVSGVFANLKAREKSDAAHALIYKNADGSLRISVRAPLAELRDADLLCRNFPTGGGRAGAAGINALPAEMLDTFFAAFYAVYR